MSIRLIPSPASQSASILPGPRAPASSGGVVNVKNSFPARHRTVNPSLDVCCLPTTYQPSPLRPGRPRRPLISSVKSCLELFHAPPAAPALLTGKRFTRLDRFSAPGLAVRRKFQLLPSSSTSSFPWTFTILSSGRKLDGNGSFSRASPSGRRALHHHFIVTLYLSGITSIGCSSIGPASPARHCRESGFRPDQQQEVHGIGAEGRQGQFKRGGGVGLAFEGRIVNGRPPRYQIAAQRRIGHWT